MQKFSDAALETHPGCGGRVEKLLSAPALQFKGTGWYVTDYARKSGSSANGSGKSETKTETKSESKSSGESTPSKSDTPSTSK
jgi:predicted nucleic acid-binding Zn ribbon protein